MIATKKKKKIFIMVDSLDSGGAERVVVNLTSSLSQYYDVYLIVLKKITFYTTNKKVNLIFLSKNLNPFLRPLFFIIYIYKLKKLIKKYQPYKIISFLEIANFVNILTNKKAIISFRTSFYYFDKLGFIGKLYKFFIQILYPRADRIIVNSSENKEILSQQLKISSTKIKTIHNPVNPQLKILKQESPPYLPFKIKTEQKIFITIGRLDKQKNTSAIIKAFFQAKIPDILLIISDGPEKENLQNLINKYTLQKQIFLLGHQKNVYAYLNLADYFIFSSQAEGFPNVLIEAMACNLPIVTSDFKTGAREIIDPNLTFQEKIKYPHYGPNGVLLSLENFTKDFPRIDFKKIQQKQMNFDNFKNQKITNKWIKLIDIT